MSTMLPHVKPPVGPSPPHYEPPRQVPPGSSHGLPIPTQPAAVLHGKGYEIRDHGPKHKPVYRVGSSTPGATPIETRDPREALARLQAIIDAAEAAGNTPGTEPPMPTTATLTVTHVPQPVA